MTAFELATLALTVTVPVAGVVFGAMRFALRQELARREAHSVAGDAALQQRQENLTTRVDNAHTRIDGVEQELQQLRLGAVNREEYVPAITLIQQKLDGISTAVARLEERTR